MSFLVGFEKTYFMALSTDFSKIMAWIFKQILEITFWHSGQAKESGQNPGVDPIKQWF